MANSQYHIINVKFNADTSVAKAKAKELQTTLNSLANTKITVQGGAIDQAAQSAKELAHYLNMSTNANTGKLDFSALNHNLKTAGLNLTEMSQKLLLLGPEGQQAFNQLSSAIATSETSAKKANTALAKFGTTLMNTIRWQISASMIQMVTQAFGEAIQYTEKLNKALTDIAIVTNKTSVELANFATRAQKAAKDLNTTAVEYSKAALIFYQQGLPEQEVAERTAATIKMAQVTGDTVSTVSDQLTAIWNNFDDGTKSLESYVDIITALGAATASSTDEIAQGLEKFAAIAETVGLSYEYATAALATVTSETRQSADVVGTAFKTLFARMQDLELGETLEDGTTLGQYSQALLAVGVNIKKSNNELKDMDDILDEIGNRWDTLNKDQQVALAQNVAGVRQYSQFMALMDNWDVMQENLEIAANSQGTLNKQTEIYKNSLEAADERLQQIKEDFMDDFLSADMLIGFKEALGDIIITVGKLIDGFTGALKPIGGLKTAITLIGTYLLSSAMPKITAFLSKSLTQIKTLTGAVRYESLDQIKKMGAINDSVGQSAVPDSRTKINSELNKEILAQREELLRIEKGLTEEEKKQRELRIQELENTRDTVDQAVKKRDEAAEETKKAGSSIEQGIKITTRKRPKSQEDIQDETVISDQEKRLVDIAKAEKLMEGNKANKRTGREIFTRLGIKAFDSKGDGFRLEDMAKDISDAKAKSQQEIETARSNIKGREIPAKKVNLRDEVQAKQGISDYDTTVQSYGISTIQEDVFNEQKKQNLAGTSKSGELAGADISLENYTKLVTESENLKIASEEIVGVQGEMAAQTKAIPDDLLKGTKAAATMEDAIKKSTKISKQQNDQMRAMQKTGEKIQGVIGKYPKTFKKAANGSKALKTDLERIGAVVAKDINGNIEDIDFAKIDVSKLSPEGFKELGIIMGNIGQQARDTSDQLGEVAREMGSDIQIATDNIDAPMETYAQGIRKGIQATDEIRQGVQEFGEEAEKNIKLPSGFELFNAGLSAISGTLTSAMAGFSMLSSGIETCFTKGASGADIFTGALTGIMGAIQLIMTVTNALNAVEEIVAAARARRAAKEKAAATGKAVTDAVGGVAKSFQQLGIPGAIAGAIVAAALVGAAVFSGISKIKANNDEAERENDEKEALKARDEAIELTKTLNEQATATRKLALEYDDLMEAYRKTGEASDDLKKKAQELVKELDESPEAISAYLSGKYEALGQMVKEKAVTTSKEASETAENASEQAGLAAHAALQKEGGIAFWKGGKGYKIGVRLGDTATDETALQGFLDENEGKFDWEIKDATLQTTYAQPDEIPILYRQLKDIYDGAVAYANLHDIDTSKEQFFTKYNDAISGNEAETFQAAIDTINTSESTQATYIANKNLLSGSIKTYSDYKKAYNSALLELGYDKAISEEDKKRIKEQLDDSILQIDDETITKFSQYSQLLENVTEDVKNYAETLTGEKFELFMTIQPDLYQTEEAVKKALELAQEIAEANEVQLKFETGQDLLESIEDMSASELQEYVSKNYDKLFGKNGILAGQEEKFLNSTASQRKEMLMNAIPSIEEYIDSSEQEINSLEESTKGLNEELNNWNNLLDNANEKYEDSAYYKHISGEEISLEEKAKAESLWEKATGEEGNAQTIVDSVKNYNTTIENLRSRIFDAKGENNYGIMSDGTRKKFSEMSDEELYDYYKRFLQNSTYYGSAYSTAERKYVSYLSNEEVQLINSGLEATEALQGMGYSDTETFLTDVKNYNNKVTYQDEVSNTEAAISSNQNLAQAENTKILMAGQIYAENMAKAWGLGTDEINNYIKALEDADPKLKKNANMTYYLGTQIARTNKGIADLSKNFEEWDNNPSGLEQSRILSEMLTNTQNLLGLDVNDLDLNFISTNFELIRQAAAGIPEAIEKLRQLATIDIMIKAKIPQEEQDKINTFIQENSTKDLPIGISVDTTKWAKGLLAVLDSANFTKEQIEDMFSAMGFTIKLNAELEIEEVAYSGTAADIVGSYLKVEKAEKIDKIKKEDVVERYKEINDQLDDLADALDKASGQADRLWGKDRLAMMKQQSLLMEKEVEMLNKRKDQTKENLEADKQTLIELGKEKGFDFQFDDMGNIINEEEIMTRLWEIQNEAIDIANSYGTKDAQDKYKESTLEPIQDYTDKMKDAISLYSNTREELEDTESEIREKLYAWQDMNFESLNYTLEIRLELNDDELKWIDYRIEKLEDDVFKRGEALGIVIGEKVNNVLERGDIYGDFYGSMKEAGWENIPDDISKLTAEDLTAIYNSGSVSQAAFVEGLNTSMDGMYDFLASAQEMEDFMETYYSDTLDMTTEELGKVTTKFERLTSTLDHYQSILELTGRSQDYEAIGKILNASVENNINATKAAAQNYAFYADEVAYWQEQLQLDPNDENAKQNLEAAENYMAEYHDALLTSYETTLEALNAELDNKLAEADKMLERTFSSSYGSFAFLDSAFERAAASQEEFLTSTNKIYETTKMIRNIQKEIDKTTSNTAKQRLKQFQTETQMLQNQEKLSKFELDIQQKKYDLLLAELALEEAKNVVSTVTLRRDAEGNFGYVYTADQEKIADAEQKYDDAQNALYNAELDAANDYSQKVKDLLATAQSELSELNSQLREGLITETEYYAERERIIAYYQEQLGIYVDLYNLAIGDGVLGQQVLTDAWSTGLLDINQINQDFANSIEGYLGQVDDALKTTGKKVDEVTQAIKDISNIDLSLDTTQIDKDLQKIIDKSKEVYIELTKNDGILKALKDSTTEVNNQYKQWQDVKGEISLAKEEAEKFVEEILKAKNALGIDEGSMSQMAEMTQKNYSGDYINTGENHGNIGPQSFTTNNNPNGFENNNNDLLNNIVQKRAWKKAEQIMIKADDYGAGWDYLLTLAPEDGMSQSEIRQLAELFVNSYKDLGAYGSVNEYLRWNSLISELKGFDTGGYTGAWGPDGKLAMLHEKELVLDKDDTANFLRALNFSKEMLDSIEVLAGNMSLDNKLDKLNSVFEQINTMVDRLEQSVHIDAQFPNVQDRHEIEEAFSNLINSAAQYAYRN